VSSKNQIRRAAVLVTAAVALICAPSALAAGGSSISAAPTVAYGQAEFGNVPVDGDHSQSCPISWWNLPVSAGDLITIDLEGQTQGDGFYLNVYPLGTNDFNYVDRYSFADKDGERLELVFRAPATGSMPLGISTCDDVGTYDFTATVQHGLVATLFKRGTAGHVSHFTSGVATPDGESLSDPGITLDVLVQRRAYGSWSKIGSLAPGDFQIRWGSRDRGKYRWVRVRAHGPGYVTTLSRTVRVKA
jgi:hypothetical protein